MAVNIVDTLSQWACLYVQYLLTLLCKEIFVVVITCRTIFGIKVHFLKEESNSYILRVFPYLNLPPDGYKMFLSFLLGYKKENIIIFITLICCCQYKYDNNTIVIVFTRITIELWGLSL